MDPVELDALAAQLDTILELDRDLATEVVVTLAEHHDRRVIAPLLDLLASGRANELMVRAAGWLADPGLHRALERLAASEAEEIEVTLLAATQASVLESGFVGVDVSLVGLYPTTEVVLILGGGERRHAIWNFDERNPDDPISLDRAFALYRTANLAGWG